MKRFAFALALAALPLASCATLPASPASVAESTVLDEQAAIGVELAYKAMRVALETATDAGLLRGERAAQAAALDNRAYAAVQATRAAYRAGNASGYLAVASEARAAIAAALSAIKGE